MKRKAVKNSRPGLWISIIVSPLLLMFAFIGWRLMHSDEDSARYRAERAAMESKVEAVASILAEKNATCFLNKNGTLEVTLPHDAAMVMTERQSSEMALHLHERTGTRVRLMTPAGQTLVSVP